MVINRRCQERFQKSVFHNITVGRTDRQTDKSVELRTMEKLKPQKSTRHVHRTRNCKQVKSNNYRT